MIAGMASVLVLELFSQRGTDRQLSPPCRLQMTEIRPDGINGNPVGIDQPVWLPPVPGSHQPAGQRPLLTQPGYCQAPPVQP